MDRRRLLVTLASISIAMPAVVRAQELDPFSDRDQTRALLSLFADASAHGRVTLPSGVFRISNLEVPGNLVVEGTPGRTVLSGPFSIVGQNQLVLRDLSFTNSAGTIGSLVDARDVYFERCRFTAASQEALNLFRSGATIRDCQFSKLGDAAIHALDSQGLLITGNRIADCGNAGIRIWRSEPGPDGSIVSNNRISTIAWSGGGNGQNGNGINVFRADEVTVSDNHISDCAFTAVRLNTTRNTIVSGNQCHNSGEVAIFSEFGFSGSVITDNIVDGAATGISITNADSDGRLAVCANNIVRNIFERSEVNPDTIPIGIHAEEDTIISGNVVDAVPGAAISVGWGPFLKNVSVIGNTVTRSQIGIAVSVVEGIHDAVISNNLIDAPQKISGMRWTDLVEPDLNQAAAKYPNLRLE